MFTFQSLHQTVGHVCWTETEIVSTYQRILICSIREDTVVVGTSDVCLQQNGSWFEER